MGLYKNSNFIKLLKKKFNLTSDKKIKTQIKLIIDKKNNKLKTLESIIHPLVRKEMITFLNKKNKILVLEIPLLIESKLSKYFDKIIFVDAKKKNRLKRYLKKNNNRRVFEILNRRQLSPLSKKKLCDTIINNDYSLAILKKNVKKFMKTYE